jgi:hypothetical protein
MITAPSDSSFILHPSSFLVIGDFASSEMQPVRACLDRLADRGVETRFAASVGVAAILCGEPGWFPEIVVVCQHWPDEYPAADVERLLGLFPLARLVCCYGLWCESDGRTREVWPLSVRVPVRCAADRLQRELEVLAGLRAPLPWTASRDECFLFDVDGPIVERLADCCSTPVSAEFPSR